MDGGMTVTVWKRLADVVPCPDAFGSQSDIPAVDT